MSLVAEPPVVLIDAAAGVSAGPVTVLFRSTQDGSGPLLWQRHRVDEPSTPSGVTLWSRVGPAEIAIDSSTPAAVDGRIRTEVRLGELYEVLLVHDQDFNPNNDLDPTALDGQVAVLGIRKGGPTPTLITAEDFIISGTSFTWVVGSDRPIFASVQVSTNQAVPGPQGGVLTLPAPLLGSASAARFSRSHSVEVTSYSMAPGNGFHALLVAVDHQGNWQIRDHPFVLLKRHISVQLKSLHVINDGANGDTSAQFYVWVMHGRLLQNRLLVPNRDISDSPSPGHESEEFIDLERFAANHVTIGPHSVQDAAGGLAENNTGRLAILTRGVADRTIGSNDIATNFIPGSPPGAGEPSNLFTGAVGGINPRAFFHFPMGRRGEVVPEQEFTVRADSPTVDSEFEYDVSSLISVGYGSPGGIGTTTSPLIVDAQFVHWGQAGPTGATGRLYGSAVTLIGPMGTAFYFNEDYAGFNRPEFTPALPFTGMIEIASGPGHEFALIFASPVVDPVFHLGSFGSVMTFPDGTNVRKISGDAAFRVEGTQVTGCAQGSTGPDGLPCPADSNGTIQLTGTVTRIRFALRANYGDGTGPDGIFLQLGGN